ncbi:MAG: SDR family NAD(P)-dependent oxidoreductase, partial [Gammaproteobacteria bacterium]
MANSFLDALAYYRQQQSLKALSINWAPWREVGMAKDLVASHERQGMKPLRTQEALAALTYGLKQEVAQLGIIHADWKVVGESLVQMPSWLENLVEQKQASNFIQALRAAVNEQREALLKQAIIQEVKKVLGQTQALDESKGFFEMGMDSLMALELKNRLQGLIGEPLSNTLTFDYPTLDALVPYIASVLKIKELPQIKSNIQYISQSEPIAIIGMSCRFPGGANSPEEFWKLLDAGFDSSIEVPKERWDIDEYYDPNPDAPGKMVSRKSCFISSPIAEFDANFFEISPREAEYLDPQQRLLLEVTREAIEDAGIEPKTLNQSLSGVFIGLSSHDYEDLLMRSTPTDAIDAYLGTGNAASTATGRISYTFGLQGPSVAVDTACSSSLVALHQACQSLRLGECDKAIAGGVNVILSPLLSINFSQAHMLAADGHCKTFDKAADGYVRGEGCGIVILKRLSDAERDNDRIMAVIKGSAVNQDGASSGLTVPNGPSQEAVIQRALEQAKLSPQEIDYIEAHGTGTSLGDPIEVNALSHVFKDREESLIIGTVKTNIGHLEAAAGIAGIIKTILALQHETIPRHLHFNEINPSIHLEDIPARIPLQPIEWKRQAGKIRRAGVSSFGFSGTNAHVILQEATFKQKSSLPEELQTQYYLIPFSAKTPEALHALFMQYKTFIEDHPETSLLDLSYSLQMNKEHFAYRQGWVVANLNELQLMLDISYPKKSLSQKLREKHEGAFLFSDNGKDWLDIESLAKISPVFSNAMQECNKIITEEFPELTDFYSFTKDHDASIYYYLHTFCLHYALAQFWMDLNVLPNLVTGTGIGLYAAGVTAKALSLPSAFTLAIAHARCLMSMPTHHQGIVLLVPIREAEKWLSKDAFKALFIAEILGSKQIIISGPTELLKELLGILKQQGLHFQKLNRDFKDYREIDRTALDNFKNIAQQIEYYPPQIKIIRSDGVVLSKLTSNDCLVQLEQPLKGFQIIDALLTRNTEVFIELGTDGNIIDWAKDYAESSRLLWINSLDHREHPWKSLLNAIVELYCAGEKINWSYFSSPYKKYSNKIALPTYPFQRQRYWASVLTQGSEPNTGRDLSRVSAQETQYFYQVTWDSQPIPSDEHEMSPLKWWWVLPEIPTETWSLLAALNLSENNIIMSTVVTPLINEEEKLKQTDRILYVVPESRVEDCGIEYGHMLHLMQKIIALDLHVSIWIITCNASSVDSSSIIPAQSIFNGLIKTLQIEHPQLHVKQIDIEKNSDLLQVMQWIKSEEINRTSDSIIAYRHDMRYVAHLSHAVLPKHHYPLQLADKAYYLITGGLGGIGFALAGWLIQHGAKHVVLIARRSAAEWQLEQIQTWEAVGIEVEISHVDVTQPTEVNDLIQYYKNSLYPIKGVFHLAGMIDDAPLLAQTVERFTPVFAAKALSAWYLHIALEQERITPDYFVFFSSIASLNGSPAQSNYAAANAFLDGLAFYRRQQYLPAIALNWGPWAEIGMAKDLFAQHERTGVIPLQLEKAWQLFELALNANPVQVGIADADWEQVSNAMPTLKSWIAYVYAPTETKTIDYLDQLQGQTREQQLQLLENAITDSLHHILNFPAETLVDINQPFYTLGLDSLMGLQLINQLRAQLGDSVVIKYEHVLQKNTIASLAEYLLDQLGAGFSGEHISRADRQQPLVLSFAQERLWFLQQLDPSSRAYCEVSAIEMYGVVDRNKIEAVYRQLIQRHESLRTRFIAYEDSAIQVIDDAVDWHLDYVDLREQNEKSQQAELDNLLATESLKYFDLNAGGLFRSLLIQLTDDHWILSTTLHHIIADGWSIGVLIREFTLAYNAAINNTTYIFNPLEIQYADYALWQRHYLTSEVLDTQLNYWRRQLADAPLLNLPLDYPRPKMLQDAGSQYHFTIPAELAAALKEISKQYDVTLYMVLMSALYVLLSRYSGQNDISIGGPIANRTQFEVENIIGFFVNMVVSRINVDEPVSFVDLLQVIKSVSLEAYAHQDTPFEKIVDALVKERDTSRTALFDVLLVLQNALFEIMPITGMEISLKPLDAKIAKFDLTFEFLELNDELQGLIEYRTHLFKLSTIERMAEHFINILRALATDPEQMITAVDFLSGKERHQLLEEWNNTIHVFPDELTIAEIFETQVSKTPDNPAIILDEEQLTYNALNQRINRLAHYLQEQGVRPETLVVICMNRSVAMVVSLLAVLKAGGTY